MVRDAPPGYSFNQSETTSARRFGGGTPVDSHEGHDHGPAQIPFTWETPKGWVVLAPKQYREVNLQPAGHPDLACYLTVLGGSGGGLSANVNRWRSQLGLDAISEEEALALPPATLFGRAAARVEITSEGPEPRTLLGVIYMDENIMATVKMTGPADLVDAQKAGFDMFCETLAARAESEDDHDHDHESESTPPPAQEPQGNAAVSEWKFEMPPGWVDAGASSIRVVNLTTAGATQCYVVQLKGEAGGLVNNLNRWLGEVGNESMGEVEIESLPKVEFMGQQCALLEASGEYRGMGSAGGTGKTLLGVALIRSDASLFVKMVGDEADVAAEKQNFIDFLSSLKGS